MAGSATCSMPTSRGCAIRRARARRSCACAPHLVHPLPIVVPTYGSGMKSKPVLRAGMAAYDLLTADRNRGIADPSRADPARALLGRDEVAAALSRPGARRPHRCRHLLRRPDVQPAAPGPGLRPERGRRGRGVRQLCRGHRADRARRPGAGVAGARRARAATGSRSAAGSCSTPPALMPRAS